MRPIDAFPATPEPAPRRSHQSVGRYRTVDTVWVTGADGYLGTHCVAALSREGFRVRGSVRSTRAADAVRRGVARVAPIDLLEFVDADVRTDEGFDAAAQGCRYAVHVASPGATFDARHNGAPIDLAARRTTRVLAAARDAGVERVVVTSSVVAMNGHRSRGTSGPGDWTDLDAPRLSAFVRSATLAERAAWTFARDHPDGPEVVAVNAGALYGPTLTVDVRGSMLPWVAAMLHGRLPLLPRVRLCMVDVRDAALVHVRALMKREAAWRRYVVASADTLPVARIAEVLAANGYDRVSTRTAPDLLVRAMGLFDRDVRGVLGYVGRRVGSDPSATIRDLEWTPTPFEATVLDMAVSLTTIDAA